jgi:hypothetical protein
METTFRWADVAGLELGEHHGDVCLSTLNSAKLWRVRPRGHVPVHVLRQHVLLKESDQMILDGVS